jgi:hypothetical protein
MKPVKATKKTTGQRGKPRKNPTARSKTSRKREARRECGLMQTERPEVPRQLVRNAPHRVRLVWEALEDAGFRIAGNSEELDSHQILIECLLPVELMDSIKGDNPHYAEIISHQVKRAKRALKEFSGVQVEPVGWRLTVWLPPVNDTANFNRRPGRQPGTRPAQEAAVKAKKLYDEGVSFIEIEKRLGGEFGHRDPQSWRKLVHRYFPPAATRK